MTYDYDLFVIGAGSGGLASSKRAASYGAKVAIAENDLVGGTCVIRGCVPKKLMVYASTFSHLYEDAVGYGWSPVESSFDWEKLITSVDTEVRRLSKLHISFLPIPGIEHAITSREIFLQKEQPKRLAIWGGGYIGVEFACIMNGLGSKVTQIIRTDLILKDFDTDIRTNVQEGMIKH